LCCQSNDSNEKTKQQLKQFFEKTAGNNIQIQDHRTRNPNNPVSEKSKSSIQTENLNPNPLSLHPLSKSSIRIRTNPVSEKSKSNIQTENLNPNPLSLHPLSSIHILEKPTDRYCKNLIGYPVENRTSNYSVKSD
jgi:hypothetical protein